MGGINGQTEMSGVGVWVNENRWAMRCTLVRCPYADEFAQRANGIVEELVFVGRVATRDDFEGLGKFEPR